MPEYNILKLLRSSAGALFRVDAEEYGDEDDERAEEGLSGEGMSEHEAAHNDTQDLSTSHDYCEYYRPKRLNAVEYEELS